ncbi:MAG: AraC family transcriptional regulator ligand-binding domain-containing protein [Pseudomonadota bacterium]
MAVETPEELRFPVYYLELAESMVRARQGDVAQLPARCGLDPEALRQPGMTLSLPQFLALVAICQENLLPGEPRSLQMLRHLPVTAHGMIGLAAMTSETLDQALDVGLRYFPLAMPAFSLHRERRGNEVHVVVSRYHDFGSPLNEVMTEIIIGSFNKMLFFADPSRLQTPVRATPLHTTVELTHECTETCDSFTAYFGLPVRFDRPENKFIFPWSGLQQPLLTSNRNAHAALVATLEQQLHARTLHKPLTQSVRTLLTRALANGSPLQAEALAQELGLSTRTLSRRLGEESTSLPALVDAVRMERAEWLLVSSDTPIARIAREVGYSETAAFSRAFKRHKGMAPSALRAGKPGSAEHQ